MGIKITVTTLSRNQFRRLAGLFTEGCICQGLWIDWSPMVKSRTIMQLQIWGWTFTSGYNYSKINEEKRTNSYCLLVVWHLVCFREISWQKKCKFVIFWKMFHMFCISCAPVLCTKTLPISFYWILTIKLNHCDHTQKNLKNTYMH